MLCMKLGMNGLLGSEVMEEGDVILWNVLFSLSEMME